MSNLENIAAFAASSCGSACGAADEEQSMYFFTARSNAFGELCF